MSKIVEIVLDMQDYDYSTENWPCGGDRPISLTIEPRQMLDSLGRKVIDFRVAFEPDNPVRRQQPYRGGIDGPWLCDGDSQGIEAA